MPVVDPTAFVHPTASLIGDVLVGPRCYVGPGASLRGDFGRIVLGAGANVQDNCVLHSYPDEPVLLEENAHVGHAAMLHGCIVRRDSLVGIHSIVMDGAIVGVEAFVGAGSFVKPGFEVPARTLAMGSPASIVRELRPEEISSKARGTETYQELVERCLASLRECLPLAAPEPGRPTKKPGNQARGRSTGRGGS